MKKLIILTGLFILANFSMAEVSSSIELNKPNIERGLPLMKALSERASAKAFDPKKLGHQDLSDLIWAAYGINRPELGKRTAPSAVNAQDIDLYVFFEEGIYIYNAEKHTLFLIEEGDHRSLIAGKQEAIAVAPVMLLMVSDVIRFPFGTDEKRLEWGAISAGLISQNISLFCAATELTTRPRATMDQEALRELLMLEDNQILLLNHPVSYELKTNE